MPDKKSRVSDSIDEESSNDDSSEMEYELKESSLSTAIPTTDRHIETKVSHINSHSVNDELCIFDLRNLVAMNGHQVDSRQLYHSKTDLDNKVASINLTSEYESANETYLLQKAVAGCSQLLNAIFSLPAETSSVGPLVRLPSYDESKIPRSLPLPQPKKETKWEKFAKEKGIHLNKEKRSRKVWDEATGTWLYRHGYQKANENFKEHPIIEVKDSEDPYSDPWERLRDKKSSSIKRETEKRLINLERSGSIATRSTKRILEGSTRRKSDRNLGSVDNPPPGVPVELNSSRSLSKRGKESTMKALIATQRSTASIGVFDKLRDGEPDRRKSNNKSLKKRKALDTTAGATEHERSLKLFKTVMKGGAKHEKEKKKGLLASGETAFDYEFSDGLGPSSFRKRKGRAGAGKLKKMTKKRIK